jgi:hypothetical protein
VSAQGTDQRHEAPPRGLPSAWYAAGAVRRAGTMRESSIGATPAAVLVAVAKCLTVVAQAERMFRR